MFELTDDEFGPVLFADELFVIVEGDVPFVCGNCNDVVVDEELDEDDVALDA